MPARYRRIGDPQRRRIVYFNADHIRRRVLRADRRRACESEGRGARSLHRANHHTTAGAALRTLAKALKRRGIAVALAQLHDDVLENLRAIGAEDDLGPIAAHRTNQRLDRAREAAAAPLYEPRSSTVTARRFCDQQEMSSHTATGRSLP